MKESLECVRAALNNSGYDWPRYKTVVNLAPADIKKEGPAFDLPIALGIVFANGQGIPEQAGQYLIADELQAPVKRASRRLVGSLTRSR